MRKTLWRLHLDFFLKSTQLVLFKYRAAYFQNSDLIKVISHISNRDKGMPRPTLTIRPDKSQANKGAKILSVLYLFFVVKPCPTSHIIVLLLFVHFERTFQG